MTRIIINHHAGETDCWPALRGHTVGYNDPVPALGGQATYSLPMQEGGYVNVRGGRVVSWTDEPKFGMKP